MILNNIYPMCTNADNCDNVAAYVRNPQRERFMNGDKVEWREVSPRTFMCREHRDPHPMGGTNFVMCCNQVLECDLFTNTCPDCGSDYNFAGQRLASRNLWDGTDGAGSPGYE